MAGRERTDVVWRVWTPGQGGGATQGKTQCLVPNVSRIVEPLPKFDLAGGQTLEVGQPGTDQVKMKAGVDQHSYGLE